MYLACFWMPSMVMQLECLIRVSLVFSQYRIMMGKSLRLCNIYRYKIWFYVGSVDRSLWYIGLASHIKLFLPQIYVLVYSKFHYRYLLSLDLSSLVSLFSGSIHEYRILAKNIVCIILCSTDRFFKVKPVTNSLISRQIQ